MVKLIQKIIGLSLLLLLVIWALSSAFHSKKQTHTEESHLSPKEVSDIYKTANLNGKISYDAFKKACKGYNQLPFKSHKISIVDFSQASYKKRFAVIDLKQKKLLYHSYTTHGQKSGEVYAKKFSNINASHQSSLGFFKTGKTYQGKHGYSLRLHGLEKGINDKAFKRAIVIHAADYATEAFVRKHKRAGRSWGCPALPPALSSKIIDCIKNGSYLFIYAKDQNYFKQSKYF